MNLNKSALLASIASVLTASAFAVQAQVPMEEDSPTTPAFEDLDKNADGAITRSEAQQSWLAASFALVDADQDGRITKPEYEESRS